MLGAKTPKRKKRKRKKLSQPTTETDILCSRCNRIRPMTDFLSKSKLFKTCGSCRYYNRGFMSKRSQLISQLLLDCKERDVVDQVYDPLHFMLPRSVVALHAQQRHRCAYCTTPLAFSGTSRMSIDRRTKTGCTRDNAVLCCWRCLHLRDEDYDRDEFQDKLRVVDAKAQVEVA